jgi:Protein of unknown function (DUF2934)
MPKEASGRSSTSRTSPTVSAEDIEVRTRLRAYDLYLTRRGAPGTEVDDWLQAEREIRADVTPGGDRARPRGRARPANRRARV